MPYRRSTQAAPSVYLSLGGLALSAVAGYVNAVALAFFHVPISHMSGAVTHLGTDMIHGRTSAAVFLAGVLSSFLFGAMVSGLLIGAARLEPSRRYGVALILEGLALCFVALCFPRWPQAGLTAAAFACGLQNGMASSYYGLIVRTTHVTGILTDIGVLLGQFIRHRTLELWKLWILGSILAGFLGGGMVGSLAGDYLSAMAFFLPAGGCLLAGAVYTILFWPDPKERRP